MSDLQCDNLTNLLDQQSSIKSKACNLCHYSKDLRQKYLFPVPSRGAGRILVIAEQAYPEEHNNNIPFSGAFGTVFEQYMRQFVGLNNIDCTFTYAIKCTSIGDDHIKPKSQEFKNCSRYLYQEIKLIDPILIIFIGKDSARSLIDNKRRVSLSMGEPFREMMLGKPRWCYFMSHPLIAKSSTGAVPMVEAHFRGINRFLAENTNVYDSVTRPAVQEVPSRKHKLVTTPDQFYEMMEDLKQYKYIAMDTETNGLHVWKDDFKLVGISLAGSVDKGYYVPLGHVNNGSKRQYKQLSWEDLVRPELKKLVDDNSKQFIFHNMYFDYCVLKTFGLDVFKLDPINNIWTHDSLLMSYLEDENPAHGLKDQMFYKFGIKPQKFMDVLKGAESPTFEFVSPKDALVYAADDAINTLMLFLQCSKVVAKESKLYTGNKLLNNIYPTELKVIKILADAHLRGVRIDEEYLNELDINVQQDLEEIKQFVFNISTTVTKFNSGPKVLSFLKDNLLSNSFVSTFEAKYGEFNAQERTLKLIIESYKNDYEAGKKPGDWSPKKLRNWLTSIVKYRHLLKVKSTYIDAMKNLGSKSEDGNTYIHANINPIGTTSGRMSSNNPNLQNIPREVSQPPKKCFHCKSDDSDLTPDITLSRYSCSACNKITKTYSYDIRRLFIPRPGMKFIAADYAGMELYLAAAVSGDEGLYEVFKIKEKDPDNPNGDMHVVTAAAIMGITPDTWDDMKLNGTDFQKKEAKKYRQIAKTVNYLVLYGGSAEGLKRTLLGMGIEESIDKCEDYINGFYKAFPKVKTWFSEQKHEISKNGRLVNNYGRIRHVLKKGGEVLSAINMLIQGLGAQIIKESLVNIAARWDDTRYPLLVIHDENVLEVPDSELQSAVDDLIDIMEIDVHDRISVRLKIDPIAGMKSLSKSDKGI